MKFKTFLLSISVGVSALFAVTDAQHQDLQSRVTALEEKPITPPYQCAENGWGVLVTAQPLYWKVSQDGLEYAITGSYDLDITTLPSNRAFYQLDLENGKARSPDFKYEWGFRLGLGYKMPHDNWDVGVNWTRYHHSASDKLSRGGDPNPNNAILAGGDSRGEYISPFWVAKLFSAPGLVNHAKAQWNMELDYLDAELGRKFYVSKFLVFRPFIGLRNAWIDQTYRLNFLTYNWPDDPDQIGRNMHVKMKNDMWAIGGQGGFDAQWLLGKGFSICTRLGFSLLYGDFDVSYSLHDQHPVETINAVSGFFINLGPGLSVAQAISPYDNRFEVKNHFHSTVYMADLFLGLCWDKSFYNDRFCISIWAGYEQGISFQQNRFMNPQYDFTIIDLSPAISAFGSEGPNFFTDRGNMTTSGGSGGIAFSF